MINDSYLLTAQCLINVWYPLNHGQYRLWLVWVHLNLPHVYKEYPRVDDPLRNQKNNHFQMNVRLLLIYGLTYLTGIWKYFNLSFSLSWSFSIVKFSKGWFFVLNWEHLITRCFVRLFIQCKSLKNNKPTVTVRSVSSVLSQSTHDIYRVAWDYINEKRQLRKISKPFLTLTESFDTNKWERVHVY